MLNLAIHNFYDHILLFKTPVRWIREYPTAVGSVWVRCPVMSNPLRLGCGWRIVFSEHVSLHSNHMDRVKLTTIVSIKKRRLGRRSSEEISHSICLLLLPICTDKKKNIPAAYNQEQGYSLRWDFTDYKGFSRSIFITIHWLLEDSRILFAFMNKLTLMNTHNHFMSCHPTLCISRTCHIMLASH